ncbi:hypothetical protein PF008_g27529 [Phytophthora fragariae]|uniref:Uncharacterized protein n=1 Tax=Phytophthora fragariae TaxID=53985 RepID=A0A6G0QDW6_9STRA|nr:hypothetical protein PF008_g27529 [Phytophthora fragariae]
MSARSAHAALPTAVGIQWSTLGLRLRPIAPVLGLATDRIHSLRCTGGSFYAALLLSSTVRGFKPQSAVPRL